ncbi:MAG: DHHA1 domain protein [Methanoregula sp. PtaU1.Bin051]|nr:MAG: DHHA1 domain protein [Methanoregula sp. PtaU1.Bin051]
MSLHAAAEDVAGRIRSYGYVEIIAHHDADGIAAGSILAHAMARAGLRFRLRIRSDIVPEDLSGDQAYLLCDLGAGMEDLQKETIVVDHHEAHFTGEHHINPRLFGLDGEYELSASGTAYLVANRLGDNRDLAGLAMLGMIGDGQTLAGMNLEIFNDGVANGIIAVRRGLRLPGRDLPEQLLMAAGPVIDGVSGDEAAVKAIVGTPDAGGVYDLKKILSLCVISAIRTHNAGCVEAIYGDTYGLDREVIVDAHSFAAVVDACGKSGHGDLGASLCLRYSRDLGAAWETARMHRLKMIASFRSVTKQNDPAGIYQVESPDVAGDVADALSCRSTPQIPIAVVARSGNSCRISARCPKGAAIDLGAAIRTLAQACGGTGGGHRSRAGATIPCDRLEAFRKGWTEAVAA